MVQASHLLTIPAEGAQVIERLSQAFRNAGLQVFQTFDLKSARASHASTACPRHLLGPCDCQLVVLLIYAEAGQPLTLLAHSQDGKTFLNLVDQVSPESLQQIDSLLQAALF
jgi:uncharacterized protein (DUF302 family)